MSTLVDILSVVAPLPPMPSPPPLLPPSPPMDDVLKLSDLLSPVLQDPEPTLVIPAVDLSKTVTLSPALESPRLSLPPSDRQEPEEQQDQQEEEQQRSPPHAGGQRVSMTHWQIRSQAGTPWCRYCGLVEDQDWKDGPWGERTLCSAHGAMYAAGTLSGHEQPPDHQLSDRSRPVTQEYCCLCYCGNSERSNPIVACQGCSVSYHRRCFPASIPPEVLKMGAPWFCSTKCIDFMMRGIGDLPEADCLKSLRPPKSPPMSLAPPTPPDSDDPEGYQQRTHVAFDTFVPVPLKLPPTPTSPSAKFFAVSGVSGQSQSASPRAAIVAPQAIVQAVAHRAGLADAARDSTGELLSAVNPVADETRPFVCQMPSCHRSYKRQSHLRQHYRRSHSGTPRTPAASLKALSGVHGKSAPKKSSLSTTSSVSVGHHAKSAKVRSSSKSMPDASGLFPCMRDGCGRTFKTCAARNAHSRVHKDTSAAAGTPGRPGNGGGSAAVKALRFPTPPGTHKAPTVAHASLAAPKGRRSGVRPQPGLGGDFVMLTPMKTVEPLLVNQIVTPAWKSLKRAAKRKSSSPPNVSPVTSATTTTLLPLPLPPPAKPTVIVARSEALCDGELSDIEDTSDAAYIQRHAEPERKEREMHATIRSQIFSGPRRLTASHKDKKQKTLSAKPSRPVPPKVQRLSA